jgi:hypothetical protein
MSISMVAATTALVFSVITWVQSHGTPEVTMNLPSIMRIGGDSFDVYLQPSFSVPREYNSLARISAVELQFSRAGAPPNGEPHFFWFDSGVFGELQNGGFGWTYEADPAPFIVGPAEPQRPTIRFNTEEQLVSPGRWNGTITAYRGRRQAPLVEHFCVLVDQEDMADYAPVGPHGVIDFRNDIPNSRTDCYWRPDHW